MPTVSVIIATYNRAKHIKRSVDSVLAQTYKDFEIIIVDDGSTDNTESLLNDLYKDRIIYLKHETNKGISAARNTGIKHARGDYIAIQDSDDEWLPDKLLKQMELFDSSGAEVGVVYCGFNQHNNGKLTYYPGHNIYKVEGYIFFELLRTNFISTQTMVIRKTCLDEIGLFDENLPKLVDWELNIRISSRYHYACINSPLVNAYIQEDSITRSLDKKIHAYIYILNKYEKQIKYYNDRLYTKYLWNIGVMYFYNGLFIKFFKFLLHIIIRDPFFIFIRKQV